MKRLRSNDDGLHSYEEKAVVKEWGRRDGESDLQRSTSSLHRNSYYKSPESGRKALSSSTSRYYRTEDEKESSRIVRKRSDFDYESYDRRKGHDWHREGNGRGKFCSSPRTGYVMDQLYRSQSFSGPRRNFPKGSRSERDRPKREGMAASWRRFGGLRDGGDESKSSTDSGRMSRMELKEIGKSKSPQGSRTAKSPAWSKDSGSERSKSVDGKKYEDMPIETVGPSSEPEEGELEPDPQPHVSLAKPVVEDEAAATSSQMELNNIDHIANKSLQGKSSALFIGKEDANAVGGSEEKAEGGGPDDVENDLNKSDSPDQDMPFQEAGRSRDENSVNEENECSNNVLESREEGNLVEDSDSISNDKLSSIREQREEAGVKVEIKEDAAVMMAKEERMDGSDLPLIENSDQILKDKGKGIALLPRDSIHSFKANLELENKQRELENKQRDLETNGDLETEGPSTRGFQFLSNDPIKKSEKVELLAHNKSKDDKFALELSLSLPNVLLPIGAQNRAQTPGSPTHIRSVHSLASSFRTNSDGFTASMSFSGSQQFTHNPSCSLTHNMHDYEQSVKSRPLFEGVDWKALSSDENKNKYLPAYLRLPSKENDLHLQSQLCQGDGSGQAVVQHLRVAGASSKQHIGFDSQLSFNRHSSGGQGFENGLGYFKERRQFMENDCGTLQRGNSQDGKKQVSMVGSDFAESIITMVVSEPLPKMAKRFNEVSPKQFGSVKECVHEIITSPVKQWQLSALQNALQKRRDITLDMLLNAHRCQLEILVALKTGVQEFVLQNVDIPSSELAEIFLNMRCRNLKCRSLLPVDECDCKICAQRSDFCRDCMCLVCSKFDNASNTCSWVGCDVCLHWCHADCGLRESLIRNGRSATGAKGTKEMQFYCVPCDHPSEMFGFVKEVFQNFVSDWTAEKLSQELEYVRRIFCSSEDARGKLLHDLGTTILSKLASRTDLRTLQNLIMNFFADAETKAERPTNNAIDETKDLPLKKQESGYGNVGNSQAIGWMNSVYPDKPPHLESSIISLPGFERDNRIDKCATDIDLRKTSPKEPLFDELESIVRIKLAEANMFQVRADDARRESEALKRIAVSKSGRIEEEYASRITKLRLVEAEETRRQKVEELQALERDYQEYFNMKMRMETDIKDLLLKMEATRRSLAA